ncbi:two-component sensor histidine kinase [Paenibacillus sp. BIHB 4019]|uniref:histidine kinase n=1 Tax=Paenibacillus sp. BIHB 4019 TaxID=1870819 RepID=A0A1B2DSV8_9BACL|nr:two-component sensor histidine kinase [Paenibacillus sp. BIHB 4019]
MLSFAVIIIAVDKAIDYYSFITIEKQMMEKADLSELSFREILAKYDEESSAQGQTPDVSRTALETLKATGKEVRIYDSQLNLLGHAENGIIVNEGTPVIFKKNIESALQGNYSYSVTEDKLLYFSIPIQDKYYQNVFVFEFVEDLSYFYDIMNRIRFILFMGAGGFLILMTLSSLYIARTTTRPIKYLLKATERFSKQQFEQVHLNRKDELGMLAAGLNQMGVQLNDYIQYQKQFVSNVSHELKTPLAAIRGFSQYLYEGENEDKDLQKIYYHLVNESDRLTALINELLMLAQFDKAGPEEIGTEKMNISDLTERVVAELRTRAEQKQITVEVKLAKAAFVYANTILLSHAIANILDNAIKYSNANTHIRVETFIRQQEAVIQVTDQGIGISKKDIARVQERFYRAENSNVAKGSGLGLSICKEIAEKFGGSIIIESKASVGTTVSIVLPSL